MSELVNKLKKVNLTGWKLFTLLIVLTVVIVAIVSAVIFNVYLNTPSGKNNRQIEFSIQEGMGVREISENLKEKGLIKNSYIFLVYLKINGLVGSIRAGEYLISQSNTPIQVADILTKGKVTSKKIIIPEGWNINQIGDYLEKQGIVKKADFIAATKKQYAYDFLKDKPAEADLEGFLFPDTYQLSYSSTAEDIVKKMLDNFDRRLTKDLKMQISDSGYNTYQIVTLASVVEKEVSKPEDRKIVAGIFLKRLRDGMPLQSDVTVIYALKTNNKVLTSEDIAVDSLFNTYKYAGLPYGPISNPGIESIQAVLSPEGTDFYYFLAGKDGVTHYAKTLEEHEVNKQKYLE